MDKRIKRPNISDANIFMLNSPIDSEAYRTVRDLLDYIFELERNLAWEGKLRSTVTGFDSVIEEVK